MALQATFSSSIHSVPQNIWGKDAFPLEGKIKCYSYHKDETLKKPERRIILVLKLKKFELIKQWLKSSFPFPYEVEDTKKKILQESSISSLYLSTRYNLPSLLVNQQFIKTFENLDQFPFGSIRVGFEGFM